MSIAHEILSTSSCIAAAAVEAGKQSVKTEVKNAGYTAIYTFKDGSKLAYEFATVYEVDQAK
jgi:hypothetical protein